MFHPLYLLAALLFVAIQTAAMMLIRPTELGESAFVALCVVSGMIGGFTYARVVESQKNLRLQFQVVLNFVKVFWKDNPILANALWKKSYPGINPPWHEQSTETTG